MPYYTILFVSFMLCTEYELPESIAELYFAPSCGSTWCQGDALVTCLQTIENIQFGPLYLECVERRKK